MSIQTIKNLAGTKLSKVGAYVVASGIIVELLEVVVENLSEIDVPDKLTMGIVNLILVIIVLKTKKK